MRREHHAARLTRSRPGAAPGPALLAVLLAVVLLTLTAVPSGADGEPTVTSSTGGEAALSSGAGGDAYDAKGGGGFREAAARAVRAHEKAREKVERLRKSDARRAKVDAAERRRKAIRSRLWNLLRAAERGAGDPVAVDASGRDGHCPVRRRGHSLRHRTGGSWTAPTRGYWLSAGYAARGTRWAHRHTGQDFAVPTRTPVRAVGPGTVRATTCGDGFGNQVVVRHRDGYFTQYAHLSRIDVRVGDRVSPGTRLGLSGATGNVTGPHLHFEVRITPYIGSAVAPLPWLRRKDVRLTK
ncbi:MULTISPECIES: M23 family metallopeptidase [Streptomyces]|uniref:M23 family metallopeptidase n=2 Tax=Streptomyces TaxID=1883 RepID=A0ABV9IQB8_9ACTN